MKYIIHIDEGINEANTDINQIYGVVKVSMDKDNLRLRAKIGSKLVYIGGSDNDGYFKDTASAQAFLDTNKDKLTGIKTMNKLIYTEFDESIDEAKAPITIDQLEKFLKSNFKNKGDKEKYDIVVNKNDTSDRDDYEEGDTLMQVAIGYDVHTKKGHVRAKDDIFFDVNQQLWYDNWGEGGRITTLPNLLKVIKNHIRDEKKEITG